MVWLQLTQLDRFRTQSHWGLGNWCVQSTQKFPAFLQYLVGGHSENCKARNQVCLNTFLERCQGGPGNLCFWRCHVLIASMLHYETT